MWAARNVRYGGLNRRYEEHRRRKVRLMDPFTQQPVEFSTPLRADNWLLRIFCPGAVRCITRPGKLEILDRGTRCLAVCDLITTFKDNTSIADLVVNKMTSQMEDAWTDLVYAAPAFRMVPKLRTSEEIRANLTLLDNLDIMRQKLVMHMDGMNSQAPSYLYALLKQHGSQSTPAQLPDLVTRHSKDSIDSALFMLYRQGLVSIDIAEVPYGPNSQISVL